MLTIVSFIVVIVVLVVVHELGHFLVAKACGVYVKEFMVGLGPKIVEKQWGETLYTIRALPIGGAVQMLGEDGVEEQIGGEQGNAIAELNIDPERSFVNKTAAQRLAILFAGPAMNFLFAIVAFFVIFSITGVPSDESIIGSVIENTPAAEVRLEPGDRIIFIDNEKVNTWQDMSALIKNYNPQSEDSYLSLIIERKQNGVKHEVDVMIQPEYNQEAGRYTIGVTSAIEKSPLKAFPMACKNTYNISKEIALFIPKLIVGKIAANQVAGPIGIAKISGEMAQQGSLAFLAFMAYISINLGIMNLLPIPALDGGRILIILVEVVMRRKLPPLVEEKIHLVGFAFLMLLMILVVFSDISKLMS